MSAYSGSAYPPPPPVTNRSLSFRLVSRSYALVLADPTLVGLVLLSGLASCLAFASIAVPAWLWAHVDVTSVSVMHPVALVFYGAATWASAFVSVLGQGTVVAAGMARLDGEPITVRQALAVAWSRRGLLAAWALATTFVVILERCLSRFGLAGTLTRLVVGIGWALATMLVVPIMIADGPPLDNAVRDSARLVKDRLGLSVRTIVRFYTPWVVANILCLLVTAAGVIAFVNYRHEVPEWAVGGLILAVLGGLGFFLSIAVQTAAGAYLNTLLYRHAVGRPTPGVDAADLPALRPAGPFLPPGAPPYPV